MLKSLHYLTASVARAIMLVALFAVGMTASADRYQISFCEEGMNTFSDRGVRVTSSERAESTGLTLKTGARDLRFYFDESTGMQEGKGIGRIILTAAPEMSESDIQRAVNLPGGTRNYKLVYGGDRKIICTPNNVATFLSLDFNISSSFLGISARTLSLVSAEVFTGYSVQDGFANELILDEASNVFSDTYNVEYPFRYTETPSANNWHTLSRWSSSSGVEADIPAGNICTFGENKTAFRLLEGRLCYIPKVNNVLLYANEDGRAAFDIFAPAGFAISEVTFRGDGVSRITPEHGTISGNMDRTWRTSEAKPTLGYARFFYNTTSDEEWIDFSTITVTYVALNTQPDVRFRIDASNVSPAVEGDMVFHYNDIDFDVIVTAPEGVQFTSVAPSFDARMTINGNVYVSGVRGILENDGTIRFKVSFPVETYDVEGSFDFMVRFPEGVICADESYNREFRHTFHFFRGVIAGQVNVSPVYQANLKELREIRVTSLIGGPFELVADRATFEYSGINGWATVGASVRLVNGAVVYTLDEPLVAGVNVNGETSIFNSPEVVYHLLGLAGGIPYTLTYNFDANLNTVSPWTTRPATDEPAPLSTVYSPLYNLDQSGLGVWFNEPITDAAGQPLEHGSNLWASYDDQPEGYQLIATYGSGEDQDDADRSCASCVLVFNTGRIYGFLVPLDPAEAAVYHLTVPEGTFYVGGKPNAAIDLTWNLIDTEPYGMFAIVNPNSEQTYKYVDKLVVAPQYGFTYYPEIVSVAERTKVNVNMTGKTSGNNYTSEVWATGTLENGNAVYTFDEPVTCSEEASATFFLPIGVLEAETGRTNDLIDGTITINPNLKYNKVTRTLPVAEEVTTYDKLAHENGSFEVEFENTGAYISVNEDYHYMVDDYIYGYMLYNPNNLYGSGISVTHVETGEPISELIVYVTNWGHRRVVAFHSDQDLAPGHYRVQCPAGAISFDDGSVNEPIDITWNLVESFDAKLAMPIELTRNEQVPFRSLHLIPGYDPTAVAEFKFAPLAQQTANIDVFFSQGAGQVEGTFSTDENGYLNIEFDKTVEYQGEVKLRIPGGVFYDTTGRVNPELEYNFYIAYYQLGEPEGMPSFASSISTIRVPILNDATVESVPADYGITVTASRNNPADGGLEVIQEWTNQTYCVSLSEDKRYLEIALPYEVIDYCYQHSDDHTIIDVVLPGQAYTHDNTNVIPNKEGVPNQERHFQFTVWPGLTYNYHFSFIDKPEGVTILLDGSPIGVNENGIFLEECPDPITADRFSFEGLPEGCECKITIDGDGEWYKGTLDFSRYAKIIAYPFDDNTVAQDDLEQSFGFVFDREVDATTVNANDLSSCLSLTDANGEPIDFMWANATTSWMGLGFFTDYTLYPGTYTFHAPAKLFRFTDGSWNPEIDYTFTVTEATHYAFADARIQQIDNSGLVTEVSSLAGRVNPFYRFILYPELSDRTYFQGYRKFIEADVSRNGEYLGKKPLLVSHYFTGDEERRPMFLCDFVKEAITEGTIEYVTLSEPGDYVITIPADAIAKNGFGNREYTLYAKVTDPNALSLVVNLSAEYSSNFPIEIYNIGSSAPGVIAVSGDAVHFDPSRQEIRVPEELSAYYEYRENSIYEGELIVSVSRRALTLYSAEVDGHGGLRSATFEFDKGLVPGLFRSRISWSEGFKLQRKLWFSYLNVANDIAYVTTSVKDNELTLHFFSAEGREFFPMDRLSNYRLTIPVNALFAFGNMVNGYSSDLSYDSDKGLLTLTFDITEPQVITDDPDYDAEHQTVAEQANTFADILLHNRESGGRTNDFNGDGNITIGDLVQFIEQNKEKTDPELEIPANETVIWAGRQAIGGNDVFYIGEDGGKEFRDNNVKPGTKVRFYFNCSNTEVGNWLHIYEGHWKGPQAYVMLENFDKATGYVTLTLTQEMIDDALTQQYWGGIFVLQGSECFTLTKVTLYTESSGTVDPSDLPDEPIFDPAYDPAEGEEILWSGSRILDWSNQSAALHIGTAGTELQEHGAKAGSVIRIYGEPVTSDDYWAAQVMNGQWNSIVQFGSSTDPNVADNGYVSFILTQEVLDQIYDLEWADTFVLHGHNFRVTKVALYNEPTVEDDPVVEPEVEEVVLFEGQRTPSLANGESLPVQLDSTQKNSLTPGMKVRIYGNISTAKVWGLSVFQPNTNLVAENSYQIWSSKDTSFSNGYLEFELTQAMIDNIVRVSSRSNYLLCALSGLNFRVTKVTLVSVLPADNGDNTGWHPTLPGDDSDPVL